MAQIDGPDVRLLSRELTVVQMHGEPGSGKSTLAVALGRALRVVVLDKDIVKSALHELLREAVAYVRPRPVAPASQTVARRRTATPATGDQRAARP